MIKVIVFDVDGVLTDGTVYVDKDGNESKRYRLTEIDALNSIQKMGLYLVAVTGEDTPIVNAFKGKTKWYKFISGCKDKLSQVKIIEKELNITNKEICYIGDGKYDIDSIRYAGFGVCPSNAIQEVKEVADIVLSGAGGDSCVYELYQWLKGNQVNE